VADEKDTKQKPRRRRSKTEDKPAEAQAEAKAEEATDESDAADAGEDTATAEPAEKDEAKPSRRRGSAEAAAATERKPAPRRADGKVVVSARARYVRSAPRKARLVMDHIRGKDVAQARAILDYTSRAASTDILKLLNSAVANAESNYELAADELRVDRAFVDEGPVIKRYRPRALGRATRINKRTSHMTIELTTAKPARTGAANKTRGGGRRRRRSEGS
jgi:ribosomal protein L22